MNIREKVGTKIFDAALSLAEKAETVSHGRDALKYLAQKSVSFASFASSANGFNTLAGAAIGGAYGAMSDDTSVLGGMAIGAVAGRYGGQGVRTGRAAYRGFRSGVGAVGPVQPMAMGQAFGSSVKMAGNSSYNLIGNDLTKTYNGFRGLFKGGKVAPPPTAVGPALRRAGSTTRAEQAAIEKSDNGMKNVLDSIRQAAIELKIKRAGL